MSLIASGPCILCNHRYPCPCPCPEPNRTHLDPILEQVAAGKIRVVLDQVFKFEQVVQAYARSASGKAVGKVVVAVSTGGEDESKGAGTQE